MKECLLRSVKSAFICPYRKQQNYAEGYLGRVTAIASYGMVYPGAPMSMWIWCIECAVFINNITAAFYSAESIWAKPYELVHNEPFMDASIVVSFGCGVLVLLTEEERDKFQDRCALMIFAHYANQHPLYTYAVYSPRTKRILFRQDCIFLTNLFPMRSVRSRDGLHVDGDMIIPYRSPLSVRDCCDVDLSFRDWDVFFNLCLNSRIMLLVLICLSLVSRGCEGIPSLPICLMCIRTIPILVLHLLLRCLINDHWVCLQVKLSLQINSFERHRYKMLTESTSYIYRVRLLYSSNIADGDPALII